MTGQEWLKHATETLISAGCEDAAFEARCLLEDIGGAARGTVPCTALAADALTALEAALAQRAAGRPLQYILGQWDFLSLTLSVGEGVLIPRPDTELLCESAARRLDGVPDARVVDLCAGSGCVGLGVASLCPAVTVTALELSDEALRFLRRNCAAYPQYRVQIEQRDVLEGGRVEERYDAILSNPPYIPTEDLATLQREVQHEPRMALDGDADGLRFYRAIAARWLPCLKEGGFVSVEVGIGQADAVAQLWRQSGLVEVTVERDLAGIPRVVTGYRPQK